MKKSFVPGWFVGEVLGTFILILFGCGCVATAVTTGAQLGVFQVAIVWGFGIAIAIHLTGGLSGAHLNPAVTVGLALAARFPASRILPYIVAQSLGAFIASGVIYLVYGSAISLFEAQHQIVRGLAGSEASAMVFGEFFPNPGGKPIAHATVLVTHAEAFLAEVVGTFILMLVVLGFTEPKNDARPNSTLPFAIGLTVTSLISLFGPLTMACFNPVRDFIPRVFSALSGWGLYVFSANGIGFLTVYILAPFLGTSLAALFYRFRLASDFASTQEVV